MSRTSGDDPSPRRLLLYGRRRGRRLRPGQRRLLEELLPGIAVPLPAPGGRVDLRALFGERPAAVWLEVGFGAGEHLAAQARAHPEVGFIGCEPYVNGVAGLLSRIRRERLDNIRIFPDDSRLLLDFLPEAAVGRVFLLFPDPWPKRRHAKRRFVSPATLDALARVMADGAEFRVASDDPGYVRWTLFHMLGHPAFEWPARGPGDWRRRPRDWPPTRYEEKAQTRGARAVYLRFRRRPRAAGAGENT